MSNASDSDSEAAECFLSVQELKNWKVTYLREWLRANDLKISGTKYSSKQASTTTEVPRTVTTNGIQSCVDDNRITCNQTACTTDLRMFCPVTCNVCDSERICFSCSGITQDEKCQHAISCDKDEICFVQKYYTHGNETKYDVGCTFQEMCQMDVTGHIIGKRNDHAHILCQKCCNDSNVCNHDLSCQNTKLVVSQKCLSCDNVDNPKSCNSSMTCAKDEVCFLHKYMTETQQVKYDLGSKHSTLCFHGLNIFGRRSSAGRHLHMRQMLWRNKPL
ncbi:Hypothetical predicted protein [Mytilus galloprovincialis]|uniref:Uncharacterized protein n=1 Tax=Mytilus galloprovincialis TaxID=29158 RepID=A0A8B6G3L1_MYTGA|nr:Hypothetical predicted protein [Mytilus galloprovincialis]